MSFEDDVFISYRHQNNDLKDDKGKGWVDHFHERLEKQLTEILGYKPRVWRDSRMPGNVYFDGHLHQQLKQTKIIVSILSPSYVQSDWCMGELQEFCRLAQENGGLEINGKRRVFKVVKLPMHGAEPPELKDQVGYHFYEVNQATGRPEEFGHELGVNRDMRYWNQLSRLAWGIKDILDSMETAEQVTRLMGNAFAQIERRAVSQEVISVIGDSQQRDLMSESAPQPVSDDGNDEDQIDVLSPATVSISSRKNQTFVCYAHQDQDFVLKLAEELTAQGVSVWIDQWSIPAGVDWDAAIDEAISECSHFLIVLSGNSVASLEVKGELRTALDMKKKIIPALYEKCVILRQLRIIQYIDLSLNSNREIALKKVLSVLGAA